MVGREIEFTEPAVLHSSLGFQSHWQPVFFFSFFFFLSQLNCMMGTQQEVTLDVDNSF